MMEALLFTLDGHRYGTWKDQVSSVETVGAVHRLPFLRSSLTVLAVMGDHTSTLADLGPCLGHAPGKGSGTATALVMSDQGQIRGFLVSGSPSVHQIEPASVIPLPEFLRIPFVEGFLSDGGDLIPVISVRSLFNQILEDGSVPAIRAHAVSELQTPPSAETGAFKLVKAGASVLAVPADELSEIPGRHKVRRFPLLPNDLDGVAVFENRVLPVVDLTRRVSRQDVADPPLMIGAQLADVTFGFLVDSAQGEWRSEAAIKDLPLICRKRWLRKAALRGSQTAAIIDLAALLSASEQGEDDFSAGYEPSSTFPDVFGTQEVEVSELRVLGRRLAVPQAEIADTMECVPIHAVPYAPGMMVGVALFKDELLPVLDLTRIMGQTSQPTSGWRMLLIRNGSFQALVLSEREPEPRLLKPDIQREVPVHLPYPVVYGCYTEGDAIRLILNIHALSLHFDESRATELLPSLTPVEFTQEIEPAPAAQPVTVEAPAAEAAQQEAPLSEAAQEEVPVAEPVHAETPIPEIEPAVTSTIESLPAEMPVPETAPVEVPLSETEQAEAPVAEPVHVETPIPEIEQEEAPAVETEQLEPLITEESPVEAVELISADETFEVVEAPPFPLPSAPEMTPPPKPPEPSEPPEFVLDEEIELTLPEAAAPAPAPEPAPTPEPARPTQMPSPTEQEKERLAQEALVRDTVVTEQPPRRRRRMLIAFIASAVLILAVVVGLYFLGQTRARITAPVAAPPAPVQVAPAQPAASQPAPVQPAAPAPAPSPQPAAGSQYTVKQGDTLWDIAQRFTGDPFNYHNLAGRNLIRNPDLIFPGQVIQVDSQEKK